MSLKLKVDVPARFKMEIRNKARLGADPRYADIPKIGNAQFDRCRVVFGRPDSILKVLARTDLADRLGRIVRRSRPITITLRNGELLFVEKSSLLLGAESDINRLQQIIGVMCDLAEAICDLAEADEKKRQQIRRTPSTGG